MVRAYERCLPGVLSETVFAVLDRFELPTVLVSHGPAKPRILLVDMAALQADIKYRLVGFGVRRRPLV